MDSAGTFQTGLALQRAGRLEDAASAYRSVLSQVLHLAALNNLAAILTETGRVHKTGELLSWASGLARDHPGILKLQANHLRFTRQLPAAEEAYRRWLAIDDGNADARLGLAQTRLAMGHLADAWPDYDARIERRNAEAAAGPSFPAWSGEPLVGRRLLVWREQGLGDQILAARFLAMLGGDPVTYAGPPALERLFAQLPVTYLAVRGPLRVRNQDCWTLPLSLPGLLGMGTHNLPTSPYLSGQAKGPAGGVGIVWRGNREQPNDRWRSLPPELGRRLLSLPGAVSLAPEDTGAADMQDTADLIAGLDLVVSVDTAVAHLAGAMGKPVWLLLTSHAWDWQWPRHDPALWYPSVRGFCQPTPGDWATVVAEVEQALGAR